MFESSASLLKAFVQRACRTMLAGVLVASFVPTTAFALDAEDSSFNADQAGRAEASSTEEEAVQSESSEASVDQSGAQNDAGVLDASQNQEAPSGSDVLEGLKSGERAVAPRAADVIDLNAAWTDTSAAFTITESGTYCLTGDISATKNGMLVVNGEGIDVTILLDGHDIDFDLETGFTSAVRIVKASSVTIDGGTDRGSVTYSNTSMEAAVSMEARDAALSLSSVSVTARPSARNSELASLAIHALSVSAGTAVVSDSDLAVDLTGQTRASFDRDTDHPSALFVENDAAVGGVTVRSSTLSATSSLMGTVRSASEEAGPGLPAYGVESPASARTVVDGCVVSASSPYGSAYGVSGRNVSLEGDATTVTVNAGYRAAGVASTASSGVRLDAPLSVEFSGTATPAVSAALYSTMESAFVLESGFSGSSLGVLVGPSVSEANEAGMVAAVYDRSAGDFSTPAADVFCNALGASASCDVSCGSDGVSFTLVESRAPAEVVAQDGSTKRYSSANQALEAAAAGQTVRLLKDVGDVTFKKTGTAAQQVTFDLNGHAVDSLVCSSSVDLTVTSSAAGGVVAGRTSSNAAVSCEGSGSVSIDSISVENASASSAAYGIVVSGSGAVTLTDVDVTASSSAGETVALSVASSSKAAVSAQGGSLSASTSQAGCAVDGVRNLSSNAGVSLLDCPVTAEGMDAATGAVRTSGAFSATGSSAGSQTLTARTQDVATYAWGVRASSDAADVSLTSCDVVVSCETGQDSADGEYWCLLAGTVASPTKATWRLDGACSLSSGNGTHILHAGEALQLGASFSTGGQTVAVRSSALEDDVFARGVDGGSLPAGAARWFVPVEGCAYTDWSAQASSAGDELSWHHATVVENARSGQDFRSLSAAVAAAQDGDVLRLTADTTVFGQLAIDRSMTIDLAGHDLTIEAGSAASNGGLRATASGEVRLADESGSGVVEILVGNSPETGSTSTVATYAGMTAAGGSFAVDGADVRVSYVGTSASVREVAVRGLNVTSGSASLENGASLSVQACSSGASFGASDAVGVYVAEAAVTDVSVDASSSVTVQNAAPAQRGGSVLNAQVDNEAALRNPVLERIYPEEGSALYDEILEKFRANAALDDASADNSSSSVYGARVYYAAPLSLDDGTYVWAFSDYVPQGEETLDNIVPSAMFMQSYYTVEPQATGVGASDSAAADVVVNGRVTVRSTNGEATGVEACGSGSWTVARASVTASASTEPFVRKSTEPFDLKDYVESPLAPQNSAWTYPEREDAWCVEEGTPAAVGVRADDGVLVSVDSSTTVSVQGGQTAAVEGTTVGSPRAVTAASIAELGPVFGLSYYPLTSLQDRTVNVAFTNLRTTSGSAVASVEGTVRYGTSLENMIGASVPVQGDYEKGGATYRFVGWKNASSSNEVWDSEDVGQRLVVDGSVSGVSGGTVTLVAQYARVEDGQHLVSFKVDGLLRSYVVDDGDRPTYAAAVGNAAVAPTKAEADDALVYSFAGWHDGRAANGTQYANATDSEGSEPAASVDHEAGAALPEAHADAVYTACFVASPQNSYVTFVYWLPSGGDYVYGQSGTIRVDYGADPIDEANALVRAGDVVTTGGVVYTFLGWSPRSSDKEALYTTSLPAATVDAARSSNNKYYGIYAQEAQLVTVTFHNGDETYAVAVDRDAASTVAAVFSSTGMASPSNGVEGQEFKGWATSPDAAGANALSGATLLSLAGTGSTLDLYAVYGAEKASGGADGDDDASTPEEGAGTQTGESGGGSGSAGGVSGGTSGGTLTAVGSGGTLSSASGGALPTASSSTLPTAANSASPAAPTANATPTANAEAAASATPTAAAVETAPSAFDGGNVSGDQQDAADASFAAAGAIAGNPAAWAVGVLLAAAVAVLAWWLLIGRRRGADDDEDAAGWSDDVSATSSQQPSSAAGEGAR